MTQEYTTDDKRSSEISEEPSNKLLNELEPPMLDEHRLYTRLNVSYAGGLGISTLAIIEIALLPSVDTAQSIGILAFTVAIPLFAYLIFSTDEAESPFLDIAAAGYADLRRSLLLNRITQSEYKKQIAALRAEAESRTFDRVLNDLKAGLIAFVAVIIGLAAFLWHIVWYHSILFAVLSFFMLYLYVRGLFKTMDIMWRLRQEGLTNTDK